MGLLGRLFGRRSSADDLPPEVERAFKRVRALLEDEGLQNAEAPEAWRKMILGRSPVDQIPGRSGSFGRCFANPIPVNGLVGLGFYLSSLRINRGPILFHRLGSHQRVDCFEIVSADGAAWDVLYLDMYYPRRSRCAPDGYRIDNSEPLLGRFYGTNRRAEPFPHALYDAIGSYTERFIGWPLVNPKVREILASGRFVPPETHRRRVDEIVRSRIWLATTDAEMASEPPARGDGPDHDNGASGGSSLYTKATSRLLVFLETEAGLIPGFSMLDAQRRMKPKPAAYVYGFVQAGLQDIGLPIGLDETDPGNLALATILMNCVANGRGSSITRMSIAEQDPWLEYTARMIHWMSDNAQNREIAAAMQIGREDFAAFAQGSTSLRWANCFE
jgi:hypothetical protein